MKQLIASRNDLRVYLTDVRSDLVAMGDVYVGAVLDRLQASDHPVWGDDWTTWLDERLDGVIVDVVAAIDAAEPVSGPCRGSANGCSCGAPGCSAD